MNASNSGIGRLAGKVRKPQSVPLRLDVDYLTCLPGMEEDLFPVLTPYDRTLFPNIVRFDDLTLNVRLLEDFQNLQVTLSGKATTSWNLFWKEKTFDILETARIRFREEGSGSDIACDRQGYFDLKPLVLSLLIDNFVRTGNKAPFDLPEKARLLAAGIGFPSHS